jgi:hypothetical protein
VPEVKLGETSSYLAQRSAPTLVFAIASLDLLVEFLLDLSLKDSSSRRFVEARSFQDVGRIDPVICSTAHN